MKPWFEKELIEADIIDFPTPKAKVIRMPNVQSYPDFITGVSDLQAKQKDGTLSQETYDKLYTDLIHRFMKKESFETPWFIREAAIGKPGGVESLTNYIKNINQLLKTKHSFPVEKGGKIIGNLKPTPGQQIKNVTDVIQGTINGQTPQIPILVKQLFKSPEIKGPGKKSWNLGYVTEGLFGMALFLGLIKNQILDGNDISHQTLKLLKVNNNEVKKVNPKTKDKISLRINLPRNDWAGLISPETYKNEDIQGQLQSLASYINTSKDFKKIDDALRTNKKVDTVEVIADGVSGQKDTTVDVYIRYADGTSTKFKRSVKSGQVTQFGQGSVGGSVFDYNPKKPDWQQMKDAPKDPDSQARPEAYSREDRWEYQETFWERFGIDVRGAVPKAKPERGPDVGVDEPEGDVERTFMDDPSLQSAFDHVYKEAARIINLGLVGDQKETEFIKKFFKEAERTAGATITHFYGKGYRVMDFRKLRKFVDEADLKATFRTTKKGGGIALRPAVVITDQTGKEFMDIELEIQKGKSLNAINMGPLLKEITTIEKRDN